MLKRRPPIVIHQLFPWYVGECCSKEQMHTIQLTRVENKFDFKSARNF